MIGGYHVQQALKQVLIAKKTAKMDSQRLRRKLLLRLQNIFDVAEKGLACASNPSEMQQWARIMGYLGQVMNSISESFDEAEALKYLKNLERMIGEAQGASEES